MNYLVGQDLNRGPYRLTFRLIEMIDNDTTWDFIEPKKRSIPQFDPRALNVIHEEKDDFRGKVTDYFYEYETLGGYNNAGGYVTYFAGDKIVYKKQVNEFLRDDVINYSTN